VGLYIVYIANIIVAGWISITSLIFPETAQSSIFQNTFQYSEHIRLIGALWGGIFILSIIGLFYPLKMSPVLVLQLIYKGSWLLVVALPNIIQHKPFPTGMATFFIIWVVILPIIIPWNYLFNVE